MQFSLLSSAFTLLGHPAEELNPVLQNRSLPCCPAHSQGGLVLGPLSLRSPSIPTNHGQRTTDQASGSPEDRTQHYAVISRVWATSPRLPFKVGHPGVEPPAADAANSQRCSCSQNRRAPICTSARLSPVRTAGFEPRVPTRSVGRSWSPGPQAGTPARCQASPRSVVSGSCGREVRLDADQRCASVPEGRHPQTDRRTSQIGTRQSRSGSGGARILVS